MTLFYFGDFVNFTYADLERYERRRTMQSVAEDAEYEDVSETECEMIEGEKEDQQTTMPLARL